MNYTEEIILRNKRDLDDCEIRVDTDGPITLTEYYTKDYDIYVEYREVKINLNSLFDEIKNINFYNVYNGTLYENESIHFIDDESGEHYTKIKINKYNQYIDCIICLGRENSDNYGISIEKLVNEDGYINNFEDFVKCIINELKQYTEGEKPEVDCIILSAYN